MPADNLRRDIIDDNQAAAARSLSNGEYVQAFLLLHALVESLLRTFLDKHQPPDITFHKLIDAYKAYLRREGYPTETFVHELEQFNRRRNRIVHELWTKGFTRTNQQAEPAAKAAVLVYGLLIDWLTTFDESLAEKGFVVIEDRQNHET